MHKTVYIHWQVWYNRSIKSTNHWKMTMSNYDPIKSAAATFAEVVITLKKAQHDHAVAAVEKMADAIDAQKSAIKYLLNEATPEQQAVVIKLQKFGAHLVEVKDSAIKLANKSNACWVNSDGSRTKI